MSIGCSVQSICPGPMQPDLPSAPAAPEAGFTLIETLVAFVIMAMSAAAFYQSWSVSTRGLTRAEEKRNALMTAASVLERVGTGEIPARPGIYSAEPEEIPHWRVDITPFTDENGTTLSLLNVTVTVTPQESSQRELAHISSLRLGPDRP